MKQLHKLVIAAFAFSAAATVAQANNQSSAQDESTVRQAQQALNDKGFNVGPVDGKLGPKTKSALKQFQQSQGGASASGQLDQTTLASLGISQGGASSAENAGSTNGSATSSNGSTASSSGSTASSTPQDNFSPQPSSSSASQSAMPSASSTQSSAQDQPSSNSSTYSSSGNSQSSSSR
jgi:peptidoglycan hydrolase-like protein with peptidoglycan-binding domain